MRLRSHDSPTAGAEQVEVRNRIHEFILTKFLAGDEAVNLTDTTPLVSGGVIDSMNAMKVGLFLEKAFAVRIAPEELASPENMETIEAMTRLVLSKMRRLRRK
jgi:acyl carrier protein